MKRLLLIVPLLLFAPSLQAQDFYAGLDWTGNDFDQPERIEIGFITDTPVNLRFFTGYATNFGKGEYVHAGAGVGTDLKIWKIPLTGMVDLRGAFGQFDSDVQGDPTDSEGALAYSGFLGLRLGKVSVGATLEHYFTVTDKVFINPVAIRARF